MPFVGVNVHCYEIESLVSTILGQPNTSDPDEMGGIAKHWNKLDDAAKRRLLSTIYRRVVWHPIDREITIDLVDDAARLIADTASRREGNELG